MYKWKGEKGKKRKGKKGERCKRGKGKEERGIGNGGMRERGKGDVLCMFYSYLPLSTKS